MAVHSFNDFTLEKSTAVGLKAFLITICMFLCRKHSRTLDRWARAYCSLRPYQVHRRLIVFLGLR